MPAPSFPIAALLDELTQLGVQSAADLDTLIAQLRRIRTACRRLAPPAVKQAPRRAAPAPLGPRPPKPGPRPLQFGAAAVAASAAVDEESLNDLAEWIVARLDVRGPQTVQQLAAAKGTSEQLIRQALGRARRVVWDDQTEAFRLAG